VGDLRPHTAAAVEHDGSGRTGGRARGLLGYLQREARGDDSNAALPCSTRRFRDWILLELLAARRAAEGAFFARCVGIRPVPASMLTDADMIAWGRALIAAADPARRRRDCRGGGSPPRGCGSAVRTRLALVRSGSGPREATLQRVVRLMEQQEAADAFFCSRHGERRQPDRGARPFGRSCIHQPAGVNSDDACFRAGILSFVLATPRGRPPRSTSCPSAFRARPSERGGVLGGARLDGGNRELAEERWGDIVTRDPLCTTPP